MFVLHLWVKTFWFQNMTHQFPHFSLKTAVRGVERPAEWQYHWYLSRCSGTCKTNPAWSMVAHHHCLTRGHLPGSSCHLSRVLLCSPAVRELHLSYQPLITRCVWSLLGACTENMSCAKSQARSLSGAQPSMCLLPWLQQQGSYRFLSFMSLYTNTQHLQNDMSKLAFIFIFTSWFHTTFSQPGLESQ